MLCDSLVNIYPDPFQTAYQAGRVSALPPPEGPPPELPSGILQNNPVVTAAAWTAQARHLALPCEMVTISFSATNRIIDKQKGEGADSSVTCPATSH